MRQRLKRIAPHARRWSLHVARATWYGGAAVLAVLAILFTLARWWLPTLAERKGELEAYLSRATHYSVRIQRLDAYWDGLYPGLRARGLEVYAQGKTTPAVSLNEVRISLALAPLLWGEFRIHSLVVVEPSMSLERLKDGALRVSGLAPLRLPHKEQAAAGGFARWLFRQNRLSIEDGRFQWIDHAGAGETLDLTGVNLSLVNDGDHHTLGVRADFPKDLCRACSLVVDIHGDPLAGPRDWDGHIYLHAQALDLGHLPTIVREQLPPGLAGRFDLRLWSAWRSGEPRQLQGRVDVTGLTVPLRTWKQSLTLPYAGTSFDWRGDREAWRLDLGDLALGLTGPTWNAGRVRVDYGRDRAAVRVQRVQVGDVARFAGRLLASRPSRWTRLLGALQPGGALEDVRLDVDGALSHPQDFQAQARLVDVRVAPYRKFPGVRGFSGRLRMERDSGELIVDTRHTVVSLPWVFREPFTVDRARGDLRWQRQDNDWVVVGKRLSAESADGAGEGSLVVRAPVDHSHPPHLKLEVSFRDGRGADAARYYPINVLKPRTIAWLERTFKGGTITRGHLEYDGRIHEFPFRNRQGHFDLEAHVEHATIQYLPGWVPIRDAQAEVFVHNSELQVLGDAGRIGDLSLGRVVVYAQDLSRYNPKPVVQISGRIAGEVPQILEVLRRSATEGAPNAWKRFLVSGVTGTGEGIIDLAIAIPVHAARDFTLSGEYRMSGGGLSLPLAHVGVRQLSGAVTFDRHGPDDGALTGQFLGGPAAVTLGREPVGRSEDLVFQGYGTMTAVGLAEGLNPALAAVLKGRVDWGGALRVHQGAPYLEAEADLGGLDLLLPAPLDRPDGLHHTLVIGTRSAGRDRQVVELRLGDELDGKLAFDRADHGWHFAGGHVGLGEGPVRLEPGPGLYLSAAAASLDVDPWLKRLGGGGGGTALPPLLARVSGRFGAVTALHRPLGPLAIDLRRQGTAWEGAVDGAMVQGRLRVVPGEPLRLALQAERLTLPEAGHQPGAEAGATFDPRRLPAVTVRSQAFVYGGRELGALELEAQPEPQGWRIERFDLTRPEMHLAAHGGWRMVAGHPATQLAISFASSDVGRSLAALGLPDQMAGGKADVTADVSWRGTPLKIDYPTLAGQLSVSAKDGRFPHIKQGATRLFGIFDLESLLRYFTLDLSPLQRGMAFNRIDGHVSVTGGDAYTRDLVINSPSANIAVNGRVGLVRKDYNLVLAITPHLTGGLTALSGWVWGPQVAVAILAVQELFKKQISKGTHIVYVVKGSWEHPVVTKAEDLADALKKALPGFGKAGE